MSQTGSFVLKTNRLPIKWIEHIQHRIERVSVLELIDALDRRSGQMTNPVAKEDEIELEPLIWLRFGINYK